MASVADVSDVVPEHPVFFVYKNHIVLFNWSYVEYSVYTIFKNKLRKKKVNKKVSILTSAKSKYFGTVIKKRYSHFNYGKRN